MRRTFYTAAASILLATLPLSAAVFGAKEAWQQEQSLASNGTLVIDNPFGNIEVIGVDGMGSVSWRAEKIVHGADQDAINEARNLTQLIVGGDERNRLIKTQVPLLHSSRWNSVVNYAVRVPRTAHVKIVSNSADRIRLAGLTGSVTVRNWNGAIQLDDLTGPVIADSLNGDIEFETTSKPSSNLQMTTVNGSIEVSLPPEAAFKWVATTIKGDFFSTLPVAGKFNGTKFLAAVNGGQRGPTISTTSMTGNVVMLRRGTLARQAQSVRTATRVVAPVVAAPFRRTAVQGNFIYSTALGDISVGQVYGAAKVETGAGETQLGIVRGQCDIVSSGGPILVGDVFGPLSARTEAGDVSINAARQGAIVYTGGGMIRILSGAGSLNLRSDGGDITVRQATGPVVAETHSGDVTVGLDPTLRREGIDLQTSQGTVTLTVGDAFGADVEAIVVTSDADANSIHSDLNGLTVRSRETVGGKTRIRATGKLNGGGERVALYAEEGDVRINVVSSSALARGAQ